MDEILRTGVYSNCGPFCQELEKFVRTEYKVKYAIAVTNATAALETCLAYLKTKTSNTQIVIPSFTFVATASAVVRSGFIPVFADILGDFTFDLDNLDSRMGKKTAGIIPCNLFGNLSPVDVLSKYQGLFTLYDSSHALNICDKRTGKYVSNFGDAEVISGHPTKLGGGWEMGIITTNNPELADFAVKYRNFGFNPEAGPQGEVVMIGTNYKPNEAACAAYLTQLETIPEITEHYFDNFETYKENLPKKVILCEPNTLFSNYSYVIIRTEQRDALAKYLFDNGVYARVYFNPIHQMEPYRKYVTKGTRLLNTELISSQVLALPTGTSVCENDIKYICGLIDQFFV